MEINIKLLCSHYFCCFQGPYLLCVANESAKENILGLANPSLVFSPKRHTDQFIYIISNIPKGKDDPKDLKPVQGVSLDNNTYTQ